MLHVMLLFILAVIPIFVLGTYIYLKDKHREPIRIIVKMLVGGVIATFITVIISLIITKIFPGIVTNSDKYDYLELFAYKFFIVAVVEELSKWLMIYFLAYHDRDYDEPYDMIVYGVFTAIGFSFVENLLYLYDGGITVSTMRVFITVPLHVCMGIFIGYFLTMARVAEMDQNKKAYRKYLLLSLIVAPILHSIYDYLLVLTNPILIIVFILFMIIIYIFAYRKVKFISSLKNNLIMEYCPYCGKKILITDETICTKCGKRIK